MQLINEVKYTSLEELKKTDPLQFKNVAEPGKLVTNLISVNFNSLFMFPEVKQHNDFIQFYVGDNDWEHDTAFIWDLENNKTVVTLDQPN